MQRNVFVFLMEFFPKVYIIRGNNTLPGGSGSLYNGIMAKGPFQICMFKLNDECQFCKLKQVKRRHISMLKY